MNQTKAMGAKKGTYSEEGCIQGMLVNLAFKHLIEIDVQNEIIFI